VHSAQTLGRQIVTEQRAFRRANPGLAPNRGAPQVPNRGTRQAPQRPSGPPGLNNHPNVDRPGLRQPTTPDRRGQRDGQRQGQSQQPPRSAQQPAAQPHSLPQPGARPQQPTTQARPGGVQQPTQQMQRPRAAARPMLPQRGRPIAPRDRRRDRQ
jgi:hypothetical protein